MASCSALSFSNRMLLQGQRRANVVQMKRSQVSTSAASAAAAPTASSLHPAQVTMMPGADVCLLSSRMSHRHARSAGSRANASAAFGSQMNMNIHTPQVQMVSQQWDMSEFVGAAAALFATLGLAAGASQAAAVYTPEHTHHHPAKMYSHQDHAQGPSSFVAAAASMEHGRVLPVVHVPCDEDTSNVLNAHSTTFVHPAHSSSAGKTLSPIRRRNARMIRREALAVAEEALAAKPLLPFSMPERQVVEQNTAVELVEPTVTATPAMAMAQTIQSNKPSAEVSVRALRGRRLQMEDEYTIHDGGKFVAVFDGHGGSGVSRYLRQSLYSRLQYYLGDISDVSQDVNVSSQSSSTESTPQTQSTRRFLNFLRRTRQASANHSKQNEEDITRRMNALQSAFRSVDREVLMDDRFFHQGSTAVVCMLHEHAHSSPDSSQGNAAKAQSLLVANIGDSRAVLSRNREAISLTKDHKPNDVMERSRIMALGEDVEFDGYVHRVKDLSLSRAIGDAHAKPAVSSEVDISRHLIDPQQDEFVILASDGLWDVLSNQEAVSFVHSKMDDVVNMSAETAVVQDTKMVQTWKRKQMSRFLANEAMRRGTADNVCVVIVWLNKDGDETIEDSIAQEQVLQ